MLLLFYLRLQLPGSEAKRNINKGFKIRAEFSNNTAYQTYNTYKNNCVLENSLVAATNFLQFHCVTKTFLESNYKILVFRQQLLLSRLGNSGVGSYKNYKKLIALYCNVSATDFKSNNPV